MYTEDAVAVGEEDVSAFSGDDSGEDQDEVGEVEVEEEEDGEDDAEWKCFSIGADGARRVWLCPDVLWSRNKFSNFRPLFSAQPGHVESPCVTNRCWQGMPTCCNQEG